MKQGQLNRSAVHLFVYADAQRKIILCGLPYCCTTNAITRLPMFYFFICLRAVFKPKTVQFFLRHQMATTASDETAQLCRQRDALLNAHSRLHYIQSSKHKIKLKYSLIKA